MSLFGRLGNILRSYVEGAIPERKPAKRYRKDDDAEAEFHEEPGNQEERQSRREKRENPREAEYYANLELQPGATFEEIKAAYKRLLKQYHPDVYYQNPQKQQIAGQISQKVNEAYQYFQQKHDKGELK